MAGKVIFRATLYSVLFLLQTLPTSFASESGETDSTRPRVGLALGGGSTKGAAHMGVLRVLDETRIPVDCIAGTSMGALVGGTYASGMPAAELGRSPLYSQRLGVASTG